MHRSALTHVVGQPLTSAAIDELYSPRDRFLDFAGVAPGPKTRATSKPRFSDPSKFRVIETPRMQQLREQLNIGRAVVEAINRVPAEAKALVQTNPQKSCEISQLLPHEPGHCDAPARPKRTKTGRKTPSFFTENDRIKAKNEALKHAKALRELADEAERRAQCM